MNKTNNKMTFWLIVLVGLVPMLAAAIMYRSHSLNPKNSVNNGELVSPQKIDQWQLTFNDQAWQQSYQWQILHTQPDSCQSEQCQNWNKTLPSVIKLLGKDRDRVALFEVGESASMLRTSKISQLGEAVWIVDPLGNIVLRYAPNLAPKQLLKDLKKLLRVSGIG